MIKLFQHLLPNGAAWSTTKDKQLRQFFQGLCVLPEDVKDYADAVWEDLLPETTTDLRAWEQTFGLPGSSGSEEERRARLAATWASMAGGQSPRYIQDTLQARGFDVFVHEWWEPTTPPVPGVKVEPTPRNPMLWLRDTEAGAIWLTTCGAAAATCGSPRATCGATLTRIGYPLVNKIEGTTRAYIATCGAPKATAGSRKTTCGAYTGFKVVKKKYKIPAGNEYWPYFLYISGATFGELANVPATREDEFEELCLKICPTQQWIGVLVKYV